MKELVNVSGASVRFGGLNALSDVSLTLHAGEIHALIGPNGAGKSTLVNCVTGYQQLSAGRIEIRGVAVGSKRPAALARLGVARTFQTPQLFGRLTTAENVRVAVRRPEGETAALDTLRRLGFGAVDGPASDLPYGQQRLLEVARALACEPALLLVDEPAAGLAAEEIALLERLLLDFVRDRPNGVLLIEHNVTLVRRLAHKISVLHQGAVIASGLPEAVLSDDGVVAAYLGTSTRGRAPA